MRFGIVILPQDPWHLASRAWRGAESLGFVHAWTYDHLSWRTLAGEPWHATMPTLAAAAAVTGTIRLGTFVSSPNFRHPVPFAKEIATVDEISGGRFTLGVGSGGTGFDATVLGQPELTPLQRHGRFAEFVAHLDALTRHEEEGGDGIDLDGEWFEAHRARMVGAPAQQPRVPFVIAANGRKGLGLVCRYGSGWVTTGADGASGEGWWRSVAELGRRLDDASASAGRDPSTIERHLSLDSGGSYSLRSASAFEDAAGRAAGLGFTDVVAHWPRREGIYSGSVSVLEEVSALIGRDRAARPTLGR